MKRRRWLIYGVFALCAMAGGWWTAQRHLPATTPGSVHPLQNLSFSRPDGLPLALDTLIGRRVVLNFWATWCPPCVEELPLLNALYPEIRQHGIELIGIGIDSPANIGRYLQNHPLRFPVGMAANGGTALADRLGNRAGGLPYTVVLDASGRVVFSKLGPIRTEELKRALQIP
ncbi:MAG: redoxin family protein [Burkholderiaceae bacterium]